MGKALGLSLDRVDAIATTMEPATGADRFAARLRGAGLDPTSTIGRQFNSLVGELLGFPRHLSRLPFRQGNSRARSTARRG